jgi:hypothetical protein
VERMGMENREKIPCNCLGEDSGISAAHVSCSSVPRQVELM